MGDPLAPLAVSFTKLTCSRFSAAQSRPHCIINREALLPLLLGRRLKHSLQTLWDLDCFMPVRSVHTDCFKRQRASCRPDHRGPCAAMKSVCARATACYPVPGWRSAVFYVFTITLKMTPQTYALLRNTKSAHLVGTRLTSQFPQGTTHTNKALRSFWQVGFTIASSYWNTHTQTHMHPKSSVILFVVLVKALMNLMMVWSYQLVD